MMMEARRKTWLEDIAIISGLIGLQFLYAGNSILVSYLMSLGFKPSTLIILSTSATSVILTPLSFFFERSKWPIKFKWRLWMKLVLISITGVTIFQSLILKGIHLTSPAIANAMPNLAPGFTFFIAWAFGLEKVQLSCMYSQIKIAGTLLCVIGAFVMSFMQSFVHIGPSEKEAEIPSIQSLPTPPDILDKEKIVGCVYLLAAIVVLSSTIVLQAEILREFPAPISLSAITCFVGFLSSGIVQLIQDGKIVTGWPILGVRELLGFSFLAGSVNGVCVTFNGWAMKKRGPVLVSIFNPIGTVITVVLSVITIGNSISMGSFGGMCIMFGGLYSVLWAKGKETFPSESYNSLVSEYDAEQPLLS